MKIAGFAAPLVPEAKTADVARQFEALFMAQMLKSARAASLADDPLASAAGDNYTQLVDQARAQLLAAQAPLGVAKLLEAGR